MDTTRHSDHDDAKSEASTHSSSPSAVQGEGASEMCLGCHVAPIEFAARPCGHKLFCKRCAMKCATGGKCKICHKLYPDLRRV